MRGHFFSHLAAHILRQLADPRRGTEASDSQGAKSAGHGVGIQGSGGHHLAEEGVDECSAGEGRVIAVVPALFAPFPQAVTEQAARHKERCGSVGKAAGARRERVLEPLPKPSREGRIHTTSQARFTAERPEHAHEKECGARVYQVTRTGTARVLRCSVVAFGSPGRTLSRE